MIAMIFVENQEVPPIPVNRDITALTPSDQNRLFRAHCSYIKFMKFVDEVPEAERERKLFEEEQKKQVWSSTFFATKAGTIAKEVLINLRKIIFYLI
jgi:hypothetical protein